jgi:hypothetical protein
LNKNVRAEANKGHKFKIKHNIKIVYMKISGKLLHLQNIIPQISKSEKISL